MSPRPYEIYLARIQLGASRDLRPWVVVQKGRVPGEIVVVPISAMMDLFNETQDFLLRPGVDGFEITGLHRECYVIDNHPVSVPTTMLERKLGEIGGGLLDDFRSWSETQ